MPLTEADLSASSIDDGSLTPNDTPPASLDPNDRSNAPRSPKPQLVLFDPRSGQQETIDLSSASSVLTLDDYKKLNKRTTERGMISGLIGGGVVTYLVKRFMPKTPSRNALSLTFLFSSAFISFSTSRALLVSEILKIRMKARQQALANGDLPDAGGDGMSGFGGGVGGSPQSDPMFSSGSSPFGSGSGTGDSPNDLSSPENQNRATRTQIPRRFPPPTRQNVPQGGAERDPEFGERERQIRDELARLGRAPERKRWAKGKGLEGEVEEENEMRDPYALPGLPRNQ
ncbi:hypothetical protein CI109_100160 [Kwoniella shandongensis]|uniref:Uncharacterized protein n=1 Tax=Kwoniella shandongensis TaxID=1734106 RepID=A0A5M6BSL2_9TREE|nr:uncharacterized protein CI109_005760 [Kwoniella shandongensis]KAA5525878.1 hypothetical protein CI109_005760 [Kwoniella shandongensis]